MWHWGISSITPSTVTKLVLCVCVVFRLFVICSVLFFSSNDVLESPFGKAGLLNILSFPVLLVQPALSCSTVLKEVYLPIT